MNGNKRGDTFDEALTAAFDEYAGRMLSSMPSDRELSKRYLVPEKTALEIRKRLRKRLRRKRLHSSKAFIYFRRIFAVILLVSAVIISAAFSGAKPGKSAGGESYSAYNGNNGYESKSYEEKEREPTSDADKSENEASDVLP